MRPSLAAMLVIAVATLAAIAWPGRGVVRGGVTVRMTVWGMPFEDRLFLDRYARAWESLRPGVRVDYQRYGDDLPMKYNAWNARGRGPEIMRLRATDYHGLVARGMLEPLDALIADSARGLTPDQRRAFPQHLMDVLRIDGMIYALPQDNAQFGLFYNRAIIREHNAAHPDQPIGEPDTMWTWDDLRRAAAVLTRRDEGGALRVAGIDMAVWSWPFMTLYAQAGGRIWSEDGAAALPDVDAGVRALAWLRALQREDRSFSPSLGAYNAGAGPEARFAAGRTALFLDGSWRVPNLELVAPDLDFGVAPLPRGLADAVVSGAVLWGISAHAQHKDEAWEMLRWLIDEPQAAAYWDTLRVAPPANLAVLESDRFTQTSGIVRSDGAVLVPPMPRDRFELRAAWLRHATTPDPETGRAPGFVPAHPYQTDLEREIERMLPEFLSDTSTLDPRQAIEDVRRAVHAVMARDRQARGGAFTKRR